MRKFVYVLTTIMALGGVSCSHYSQKNDETAVVIDTEDFTCLCCIEEAPADSVAIIECPQD